MKISIVQADTNSAVKSALKERVKSAHEKGGEVVVVVPDSYTLTFEQELVGLFGASFRLSVVTFRRLLSRLLTGERRYVDRTAGTMAVRAAVSGLSKRLSAFGRSVKYNSFSERAFELIASLKNCGIRPGDLSSVSKQFGILSGKLSDLSLIYEEYERIKQGADSADLFAELPALIRKEENFKTGACFFAGFDIFTRLGEDIFLACAETFSETAFFANSSDKPCFAPVLLSRQISGLLAAHSLPYETSEVSLPLSGFEGAVQNQLFGKRREFTPVSSEVFFFAGTREEELENAARRIKQLLLSGCRMGEIAVVFSDSKKYTKALSEVFASHELTYWLDRKFKLSDHPTVRFLSGMLSLSERGFDPGDALALVKNELFFALTETSDCEALLLEEGTDAFENYVLKYGISGKRFLSPFEGFDGEAPEQREERLAAEFVRSSLERISKPFLGAENVGETFSDFLLQNSETFERIFSAERTDETFASVSEQVPDYLSAILQNIREVFGNPARPLFSELFASGTESQEISEIPLFTDCVFCGEKESVQYRDFRALFVLGMNEGEFPAVTDDGGLLSDRDIELLAGEGVRFYPKNSDNNVRVRFSVYKLLTNRYETRSFSYTLSARPAEQFAELLAVCGGELSLLPEPLAALSSTEYRRKYACSRYRGIEAGETDDYELFSAVYGYAKRTDPELVSLIEREEIPDHIPAELAEKLFYPGGKTSVSSVETYYRCPFRHFAQYGLRAKERELAEMRALNIGNILHAVLEGFIGKNKDYSESAVRPIFDEVMSLGENRRYRDDPKFAPILSRLYREAVKVCLAAARTFTESKFVNHACELSFGLANGRPAIPIPGTNIKLSGVIDRVDLLSLGEQTLCRVVDYKSGRAKFEEDDLYFGKKVQLFVYLYALGSEGYKPAGAYYFPVHNKFTKEESNPYKLRGVTLADSEVLQLSDFALADSLASELIDVKFKNFKELSAKNLLTADELSACSNYALSLSAQAVRESCAGDIRKLPAEGACEYCPYLDVCGNYESEGERSQAGMDRGSVSAAIRGKLEAKTTE